MNNDPANFYARLASAQAAEERKWATEREPMKPKPVNLTDLKAKATAAELTLTDLKTKATAAELTLIEKVEELVQAEVSRDAEDIVMRRAENWIIQNRLIGYSDLHDWCSRLAKVIRGQ